MKSIRTQLLIWLVPSFIVIAMIVGASLYLSEKNRLEASLDNELVELARSMKLSMSPMMKRPMPRFGGGAAMEQTFASNIKLKFEDVNSGYYFQAWDQDGLAVRQSLSLGKQQLPYLPDAPNESIFQAQLVSGDEIRIHWFSLRAGPRVGELQAAVAINKHNVNQQLIALAIRLVVGGICCCLLLCVILVLVIKKALSPLQDISEQVAHVEAGTLDNRLSETRVPAEISPLVNRVNQLLARLEQSFARERQFNGDLAHELRNPLAAIRTTSEVALKWPEQFSIDDFYYIAQSTAQLQQTIDSLLTLARIENSHAQSNCEDLDVSMLVEECLALQANQIEQRGLSISQCLTPGYLNTDPVLLRIIISNLISNAVEYAAEHSIIIINDAEDCIVQIINIAPQLCKDDLTTMFDRLWRKDSSRTGTKHVGLGLSIAHCAAQAISCQLTAKLDDENALHMTLRLDD